MSDTTRRRLLEPGFVYRKASETDLAATFKRIRRQQKAQQQSATVTPIKRAK